MSFGNNAPLCFGSHVVILRCQLLVGYVGIKYKDNRRRFKHRLCVVSTLKDFHIFHSLHYNSITTV
jgi:hypothetical protein